MTGDEKTPIALASVGKIHGRLVAPPEFPQPITGVKVRVRSKVGGFDGSGKAGEAETVCDPSGRFEVPAIAAGLVAFELVFDHDKGTPAARGGSPGTRTPAGIEARDNDPAPADGPGPGRGPREGIEAADRGSAACVQ